MPKRDRVYLPQSTAGLIRYFEGGKEAIKIKPEYIVTISVIIIVVEIALKFMMI